MWDESVLASNSCSNGPSFPFSKPLLWFTILMTFMNVNLNPNLLKIHPNTVKRQMKYAL